MVFKRREKRSVLQVIGSSIYPKGGWGRAAWYVKHRLTRLPDAPHRIARGIFAGIFVSFTPFFGFHFLAAALVSYVLRGNILAGLLATFLGNPLTFPFIAVLSLELGNWMLGTHNGVEPSQILGAFSQAGGEVWHNIRAIFTDDVAHWSKLHRFFFGLYLPYTIGGIGPGIIAGLIGYYLSLPLIAAYKSIRSKRLAERFAKLRAAKLAKAKAADDIGGNPS